MKGEPASLESVGCTLVSEAQAPWNAEDKLVELPGLLEDVKSNVLVSASIKDESVSCCPERKRCWRKWEVRAKGRSCHKQAEIAKCKSHALGSQHIKHSVRRQIGRGPTERGLNFRPAIPQGHAESLRLRAPLRLRLGEKRSTKERISNKLRCRGDRLVLSP